MALTDRAEILAILRHHDFHFNKAMGQNFLVNPTVCPRMAEEGGAGKGVGVLEIGPGIGVLTRELAASSTKVVCVELDKRLLPILKETLSDFTNVTVINGDAMKEDLAAIIEREFAGLKTVVCANLPYYITTPILMRLLEEKLPIESITVMVQKEAAQRLCAAPGERACGAISAAVSYYSNPQRLFTVTAGSFMPAPKVESQVIRLDVLKQAPVTPISEAKMFAVIKAAFAQRRKRAVNSISSSMGMEKSGVEAAFSQLSIDPNARAEQLTLKEFAALSDRLY